MFQVPRIPFRTAGLALAGVFASSHLWAAGAWFDDQNRPRPVALQAVQRLADAASDGLDPARYDAARLRTSVQQARQAGASAASAQQLEQQLDTQVTRYLSDLHDGRVDPRQLSERYDGHASQATPFNAATTLQGALAQGDLGAAWKAATPTAPGYDVMRKALQQERALAQHPAWATPLPALPVGKLAKGHSWAGLPMLVQRLAAMGDMTETAAPAQYDATVQAGVKSFQQRMGLPATGTLNKATLDALNTSPIERANRIALTLERMRWTPLAQQSRMIVVNVPEFRLRAYEIQDGKPVVKVSMKVIVGKALDTRTPLFDENMRFIEFAPYWNVPPSIARSETIPKIRRDPGYMARNGFEIVGQGGLDGVLKGTARIRQKPGPKNALGDIKFVFPNNQNIYLHHTSTPSLFNRDKRDFSHGCVRVEEPVALAQFVLQDDPAWTEDRIRKAMAGKNSTLRLKEPIPVVLTYMTAIVSNGQPHYFADLYGHDKRLAQLLAQGGSPRKPAKSATSLQ